MAYYDSEINIINDFVNAIMVKFICLIVIMKKFYNALEK